MPPCSRAAFGAQQSADVLSLGRRRLEFLDHDGPAPRDNSPTRNRFSLAEDCNGWDIHGWLDKESAAILRTALSPLCAPAPADDGERDARSVAERLGDGLIELARRALIQGELPTEGGERPHVTVTVGLDVLQARRVGNGLLDFADNTLAGVITAEDARRWACDASITRIVLGPRSEPSTSAAPPAPFPGPCAEHWCNGTADAHSPAAPFQHNGRMGTTFNTGRTADQPHCRISCSCAGNTMR